MEESAGLGEGGVGLGSSFKGAGFGSVGSEGDDVAGESGEEELEESWLS